MMGLAAERYGDQPAATVQARRRVARRLATRELGEIVSEIARGLIDLGLEPGRPRGPALHDPRRVDATPTSAITSAGGVVVPIYPTNSPEECEWVAGNSESRFVVCEDAEQVAKIAAVRDRLPDARGDHRRSTRRRRGDAIPLDDLRERGRGRDAAEVAARAAAVKPEDPYTIIYTSGTTGPPKGCVLTHGNYRSVVTMCEERRRSCTRATSSTSTSRSRTRSRC